MATMAVMRVYQTQFDAHPAATLAATNGGLSAIADVVAQTAQMMVRLLQSLSAPLPNPSLTETVSLQLTDSSAQHKDHPEFQPPKPQRYDLQRTLRFAAFGIGQCSHLLSAAYLSTSGSNEVYSSFFPLPSCLPFTV